MMRIVPTTLACLIASTGSSIPTTTSEAYIPSEIITVQEQVIETPVRLEGNFLYYEATNNTVELKSSIEECETRMENATTMLDAARACGYAEDHPVIALAQQELLVARESLIQYENQYDLIMQEQYGMHFSKYPIATQVWIFLKDLGYNDYVCAGILGNMMAEVGGQTLELQYWLVTGSHIGLCQWSTKYYGEIPQYDVQAQCELLAATIEEEFANYGRKYRSGFTYEDFLNLQDAEEAAKAFALCYERSGSSPYRREKNAIKAYDFFVKGLD